MGVFVPAGLQAIVMQLLEKDPVKKITSAGELHRRIRNLKDLPEWSEAAALGWWSINLSASQAAH